MGKMVTASVLLALIFAATSALFGNLLEDIAHPDLRKYPAVNIGLLSSICSAFTMPNAEETGFATFMSEYGRSKIAATSIA